MTNEQALTLLLSLRLLVQSGGVLSSMDIADAKEAITANQKHFTSDEVETIIVSLTKLGEWEFAEAFVRACDDENKKSCNLASLAIEMIEMDLLEEAARIAESIPATNRYIDALLCKLDLLETLAEKHVENRDLEKAATVLATIGQIIPRLHVDVRRLRIRRWAGLGEKWWTMLGNKTQAIESWRRAVEQINIPFTAQDSAFDDRYQAWESVGEVAMRITKCGGLDLAKNILSAIIDEKSRNDAIRYAWEFSSRES